MADNPERKTNKERLKEITDGIEQGITELFESDRYRQYLSVMSRFHRYSLNNTMLIYLQKPDASLVAGFEKWKKQFGRHVKKGEHGITIIAPTPFKKKVEEVKLDPETKAPLLDKDGNAIIEEKEINIPMFKPVKVFDVSQTVGKPLPQLAASLYGNVQQYEIFVEALRRSAPVPITFKALAQNMDGFFSPKDQSITIREGMSEVQTISALVHEIAHSKLHNPALAEAKPQWKIIMVSEGGTKKDYLSGFASEAEAEARAENDGWRHLDENEFEWRLEVVEDIEAVKAAAKDRRTEEVEAESVSYAVCQYYGIQTGENSFGYIASWSKDKDLKELKASLETINKTSSELITDINQHFVEICKERSIDPKALTEQSAEVTAPEAPGPEPKKADAYQRYAARLCDYLEGLHQDGKIKDPFPNGPKEESVDGLAEIFRHGGFDSAQRILNDVAEQSGILPTAMLDRLLKLSDEWDKGLTFQLEPNELRPGTSFVTPYEKTEDGLTAHSYLFSGPTEVCQKLLAELNEGTMTARQARALNRQWEEAEQQMPPGDPERLYLIDGDAYLHIQSTDQGFDYTLYDALTMKERDGGQFSVESMEKHPATTQMDAAYREVCVLQGMEPVISEVVSLDLLEGIHAANELPPATVVPLDTYPVPDETVSMDALTAAGYSDGDMLPMTLDRANEFMEDGFTVYHIDGGEASMCMETKDLDALPADAVCAIPREEWEASHAFDVQIQDRLKHQEERETAFQDYPGDAFAIYQMRFDNEWKFFSYDRLPDGAHRQDYDLIYTRAGLPEGKTAGDLLENLFFDFNEQRPADYHAHSLSVSDIVALKQGDKVSYHYCDSFGFKELPDFQSPENYLKNTEMALEDDYNMIDGIINNGPKQPTVEELEDQVKAGQTISLMDLANAVQAERRAGKETTEKRPSMLARLREPTPKQERKPKSPKKHKEQER